jgi:hypothetical protein
MTLGNLALVMKTLDASVGTAGETGALLEGAFTTVGEGGAETQLDPVQQRGVIGFEIIVSRFRLVVSRFGFSRFGLVFLGEEGEGAGNQEGSQDRHPVFSSDRAGQSRIFHGFTSRFSSGETS